jgi:putative cardiolipin synthase
MTPEHACAASTASRCMNAGRVHVALAWLVVLAGCALPPPAAHDKPPSRAFEQPQQTTLARRLLLPPDATPGASALRLLASGHEAFAARAQLAEQAQHTLDLQYHLIESDDTALLLLQRAYRAAQRGVRVRVLIDDIGSALPQADLAALAQHPRIEVRLFNPFHARGSLWRALEWLGNSKRLNRRMHNKLWIADNAAMVIGGRNLGNAYFDTSSHEGFADLDLLVAGPAVPEASASFDALWNSDWAVPIAQIVPPPATAEAVASALRALEARAEAFRGGAYAHVARSSEFATQVREGRLELVAAMASVYADAPPDESAVATAHTPRPIFAALRQAVLAARRELILVTPYLVPGDVATGVLCGLAERGVAVRVLTNSLASTDVPAVHSAYARYRPRLLACGVQVHELRPAEQTSSAGRRRLSSGASLHAKALVVDREQVFMGSMNFDPRSRQINTEVALHAASAALGARLGGLFDEALTPEQAWRVELERPGDADSPLRWSGEDGAQPLVHHSEPDASTWQRLAALLLGALIDEELL